MNLDKKTNNCWDQAPDCNYQCGAQSLAQQKDCDSNHKICVLCDQHMIYTAHEGNQESSSYSWNIDHKFPRSQGGTGSINNLQAVHVECVQINLCKLPYTLT